MWGTFLETVARTLVREVMRAPSATSVGTRVTSPATATLLKVVVTAEAVTEDVVAAVAASATDSEVV